MRVLFTTWAWPSHYYPMVPLAWAMRAAGHEVRVATQPALVDTVIRSGLTAAITGTDFDVDLHHRTELDPRRVEERHPPSPWTWDEKRKRGIMRGLSTFVRIAEHMAAELVDFARGWRPDLLIFDPLTYAGPIAAQVIGVPAVRSLFGPDIGYDTRHLEGTLLSALADRFGLSGVDTVGELTVDPCPPSIQFPALIRRLPIRYIPYHGLGVVPRWVLGRSRRRRVCLTWGTSTIRLSGEYAVALPRVLEAISGLDAEIVLVTGADQVKLCGRLPPGVRVAESAPLSAVVPGCDAIIHQGGAGTALTSALYGLPQMVVAQYPDQTLNAQQISKAGAGRYLIRTELSREAVRSHVMAILNDPEYRARAARLRDEILGTPPPAAALGALEELAAR